MAALKSTDNKKLLKVLIQSAGYSHAFPPLSLAARGHKEYHYNHWVTQPPVNSKTAFPGQQASDGRIMAGKSIVVRTDNPAWARNATLTRNGYDREINIQPFHPDKLPVFDGGKPVLAYSDIAFSSHKREQKPPGRPPQAATGVLRAGALTAGDIYNKAGSARTQHSRVYSLFPHVNAQEEQPSYNVPHYTPTRNLAHRINKNIQEEPLRITKRSGNNNFLVVDKGKKRLKFSMKRPVAVIQEEAEIFRARFTGRVIRKCRSQKKTYCSHCYY
jgi:hypothetical protein